MNKSNTKLRGKLIRSLFLPILMLANYTASGQNSNFEVTLEDCYQWSLENYPLTKQLDLIDKSTQYSLENASNGNLPQISLNGQATYQSDVTAFPIDLPNLEVPTIDKDQYKIYTEIYQPLTRFSNVSIQKEIIKNDGLIQKQNIEIDLYKLRDKINQLFFGILLIDKQMQQLETAQVDIDSLASRITAAINAGTAVLADLQLVQIEALNLEQKIQENQSNLNAFYEMLSALTGKQINEKTELIAPSRFFVMPSNSRPELELFELQRNSLMLKDKQLQRSLVPNIGLFGQGGYGRPALNFLSNDFEFYYIGGLKFNWNISQLYNYKNAKKQLSLSQEMVSHREDSFLLNTSLTSTQQSIEMKKYDELIASDIKIVDLREQVLENADIRLSNGLITAFDYLKIMNDLNRSKQMLLLHETQYLLAQSNLRTTQGL